MLRQHREGEGRPFSKITREQRDEIAQSVDEPSAVALKYGISEPYVRTIQWRWRQRNKVPNPGHKIKLDENGVGGKSGFALIGKSLEAYLAQFQCLPVPPERVVAHGVTFEEVTSKQCMWPIGVGIDGERRFCGHVRLERKSYCVSHHSVSLASRAEAEVIPFPGKAAYAQAHEFLEAAE